MYYSWGPSTTAPIPNVEAWALDLSNQLDMPVFFLFPSLTHTGALAFHEDSKINEAMWLDFVTGDGYDTDSLRGFFAGLSEEADDWVTTDGDTTVSEDSEQNRGHLVWSSANLISGPIGQSQGRSSAGDKAKSPKTELNDAQKSLITGLKKGKFAAGRKAKKGETKTKKTKATKTGRVAKIKELGKEGKKG